MVDCPRPLQHVVAWRLHRLDGHDRGAEGHEGRLVRGHEVRHCSAREVGFGTGMVADEAGEAGDPLRAQ